MEVKEAIEKVQNLYTFWINYLDLNDSEIIKTEKEEEEIIELLQQGEALKAENVELKAYKQMWDHISVIYKGHGVESDIKALEQKYFPKEVRK